MSTLNLLKIAFVVADKKEEQSFRNAASKVRATVQFYFLNSVEELTPYLDTGKIDMAVLDYPKANSLHHVSKYFNKIPFVFFYEEQDKPRIIKKDLVSYIDKHMYERAMHVLPYYINKLLLERSQNLFHWTFYQVMQQGSAAVVITNLEGDIEYTNTKFTEMTAYEFDDVVGRKPSCLKSEQMDRAVYAQLWENITKGKNWKGDLLNKRKDGSLYWERALISPMRTPNGDVYAYAKIAEDITEQKNAAEELRLSEERYRSVIDNINIGIAIIDRNMRVLALNKKMRDWFPAVDPLAKPFCYKVLNGVQRDAKCSFCPARKSFRDAKVHETMVDSTINDKVVTYRLVSCPIKDKSGEVVSVAELVEDVTSQRKSQIKMKEALEIQSEFTAMVSHELRTPLTAIKESINIVYDGITGDINDDQKEFLGLAKDNVDRLARLINDILDFQKLEAGKVSFHMQANDLCQTVKAVEHIMIPLARDKNIALDIDMSYCPDSLVYDSDRITQVLTNLLSNAIKFTDSGKIKLSLENNDNYLKICVADSGMGIKEDDMPRLFQKFEQLSKGHGRETGGTGLGLAICKQIVEQHSGRIWAESHYGQGTKFYFTLPKVADQRMWLLHKIDVYLDSPKDLELNNSDCALIVFKIKAADGQAISVAGLGDDGEILSRLLSIVHNYIPRTADLVIEPKSCECLVFMPDYARKATYDICAKIRADFNRQEEPSDFKNSNVKLSYAISFCSNDLNCAKKLIDNAYTKLQQKKKLLVIDDQEFAMNNVVERINSLGVCQAQGALGALKGLEIVNDFKPDMIVLDVNMPEMNGYEVLGHLRGNKETADVPVVLLTGSQDTVVNDMKIIPGSVLVFAKTEKGMERLFSYINKEFK